MIAENSEKKSNPILFDFYFSHHAKYTIEWMTIYLANV